MSVREFLDRLLRRRVRAGGGPGRAGRRPDDGGAGVREPRRPVAGPPATPPPAGAHADAPPPEQHLDLTH